MLQAEAHREIEVLSAYQLVIADGGLKNRESIPQASYPQGRVIQIDRGRIIGTEVPISTLARLLSEELGHPVLDKTGLTEHFDIALQWPATENDQPGVDAAPSISEALQDQLGLKLAPTKIFTEIIVIDHASGTIAAERKLFYSTNQRSNSVSGLEVGFPDTKLVSG